MPNFPNVRMKMLIRIALRIWLLVAVGIAAFSIMTTLRFIQRTIENAVRAPVEGSSGSTIPRLDVEGLKLLEPRLQRREGMPSTAGESSELSTEPSTTPSPPLLPSPEAP